MNFPFICSSIEKTPAFVVYTSQLIQYSRACGSYPLRRKGAIEPRIRSGQAIISYVLRLEPLFVNSYEVSVLQMNTNMLDL